MSRKPRLGDIVIIYTGSPPEYPAIVSEILNEGEFRVTVFHPYHTLGRCMMSMETYDAHASMPFTWRYQDDDEAQS